MNGPDNKIDGNNEEDPFDLFGDTLYKSNPLKITEKVDIPDNIAKIENKKSAADSTKSTGSAKSTSSRSERFFSSFQRSSSSKKHAPETLEKRAIPTGSGDNDDAEYSAAIARSLKDNNDDSKPHHNDNDSKDRNEGEKNIDRETRGDIAYYKSYIQKRGKGDHYDDNDNDMKLAIALSITDIKTTPIKALDKTLADKEIPHNKNDFDFLSENIDDNGSGTNTELDKCTPDKDDIKDIWGINDGENTDFMDFNHLSKSSQSIDNTRLSLFEPSKPHQSIEYFETTKHQPLDLFNLNSNDSSINNKHESQVNPFDDHMEEDLSINNNTNVKGMYVCIYVYINYVWV
jgi:hypothetical protein